jgi:hypothetical protein
LRDIPAAGDLHSFAAIGESIVAVSGCNGAPCQITRRTHIVATSALVEGCHAGDAAA